MTHLLQIIKEQKREMGELEMQWPKMVVFREKVSNFSLDLRQIQPSAVFGSRRKTFYAEQATRGLRFCEFLTNSER